MQNAEKYAQRHAQVPRGSASLRGRKSPRSAVCVPFALFVLLGLGFQAGPLGGAEVFDSIQKAIEAAEDGTEILVAPGVYRERIDFLGKSLSLRAAVPNPKDPNKLIPGGHPFDHLIVSPDGRPGASMVTIGGDAGVRVVFEGFRVEKGISPRGAGVAVIGKAQAEIARCIIRNNLAEEAGGGVFVGPEAGIVLVSTAVIDNEAQQVGSAILVAPGEAERTVAMVGCTVTANRGPGGAVFFDLAPGSSPCLLNNILVGNVGGPDAVSAGELQLSYSMVGRIEGFQCREGCLFDVKPFFAGIRRGNFRLLPKSPGIDAAFGNPPCLKEIRLPFRKQDEDGGDFEGDEPFNDPDTPDTGSGDPPYKDMGADEYLPVFVRADANADGVIDISDPISVLDYLFGTATNTCDDAVDSNDDGGLDVGDVVWTLSYLFAGGPWPPAPFPTAGTDPTPDSLTCTYYGPHP